MKKIRLKQEENWPDKIIGISSLYADFQIALDINEIININLSKVKDFKVDNNNEVLIFSLFSYTDGNFFYFLLSNKDSGKNLSSKYKNIDFFFIIKPNDILSQDVSNKIAKSDFISGSFLMPTDNTLKKVFSKIFEY